MRRALEAAMRRMNTAEPGVIEAYNAATCTADVQPLVMRVRLDEGGERVAEKAPVVTDVPVYFPGGGGHRLTFPVKKGDQCLLVASSQPLDQWHSTGTLTDPKTTRHHHISDSIALVGLMPAYKASPASPTSTVLEGDSVCIGGEAGAEPTFRATAYNTALSTWLTALSTFCGTCTTVPAGSPASTFATATSTFLTAVQAAITAKAKVS